MKNKTKSNLVRAPLGISTCLLIEHAFNMHSQYRLYNSFNSLILDRFQKNMFPTPRIDKNLRTWSFKNKVNSLKPVHGWFWRNKCVLPCWATTNLRKAHQLVRFEAINHEWNCTTHHSLRPGIEKLVSIIFVTIIICCLLASSGKLK